jgi:hypothetical protein
MENVLSNAGCHDQPVRFGLHDRLWQRSKVCLPGFILLGRALVAALLEGQPFAELRLVPFIRHGISF